MNTSIYNEMVKKEPDKDTKKIFKVVKCFLKASITKTTTNNSDNLLNEIEQYVLILSSFAQKASKFINASVLNAFETNKMDSFNFNDLQTYFNHAMEYSQVNKHIHVIKTFHPIMEQTYNASPAEWDIYNKEHNLNRTILCQMKTTLSKEYVTNTITSLKKLPFRIYSYCDAYWRINNPSLWVKCKKSFVKKAFINGINNEHVPDEIWKWIKKERALLDIANEETISDFWIGKNIPNVLKYLHHILKFWDKVNIDKTARWKGFTLFPLYGCDRINITADELFLYYKSGLKEQFERDTITIKKKAKEDGLLEPKAKAIDASTIVIEPTNKRKERIASSKKQDYELKPYERFKLLGTEIINSLWSVIIKSDKFETHEWKFSGSFKTDGISVSFLYVKTVKVCKTPIKDKDTILLEGKRILSVDPGRCNMATVVLVENLV